MATDEREPYSILGRAGADPTSQIRLVGWHMRRAREAQATADALAAPLEAEIDRLQRRVTSIRARSEREVGWHANCIRLWVHDADVRERIGKSIPTAHGTVVTRATRGKTEIDEDAAWNLVGEVADFEAQFVRVRREIDKVALRKRLALNAQGQTVDTETGEVLPDVLRQLEPPGVKVELELDGGTPLDDDQWDDYNDVSGYLDAETAADEGDGDAA